MLSKRRLSPYFLFALLVVLGWASLRIVGVFLNFILTGLFLGYLAYPGYEWFLRRVKVPAAAALTMVFILAVTILVPIGFLVVELAQELRQLLPSLDPDVLSERLDSLVQAVGERLGFESGGDGEGGGGLLAALLPNLRAFLSRFATSLITSLAAWFVGLFIILYILYYCFIEGRKFLEAVRDILPMQEAHRDLIFHEVGVVIKAVMFGQVLTSLIQAALAAVGFVIFGVPNAVLWSTVTFILALLPIVGPPLVWVPLGVYLIASGHTFDGIGLLVYSAVMVSTLDNIIRPKLIGDRADVHPTVVLIGVLGGLVVFGFSGFILGPLVLSIFVTVLNVYRKEFAMKMDDGPGREPFGLG